MPKIQMRRDTAANWKSVNPVLLSGEWALETDTKKMKIGDGSTAYNSLPYSTAEDRDEWQKPDEWVDISSGALPNSVYFLVAHSVPTLSGGTYSINSYPKFSVYASVSNSGTYDVYVDGIKAATTNNNTATTIDWATLYNNGIIVGGYDVTYPSTLTTHVVRITPSNSANTISHIRHSAVSNNIQYGTLWEHFTITNTVNLQRLNAGDSASSRCRTYLLEAITSADGLLKSNNIEQMCLNCNKLKTIPVIDLSAISGFYLMDYSFPERSFVG